MSRKTIDKQTAYNEHVPRIYRAIEDIEKSIGIDKEWARNQVWSLYGQVSILRDFEIIGTSEVTTLMSKLNRFGF